MKNLIIGAVIVVLAVVGYMIGTGGSSGVEERGQSARGDSVQAVSERGQRPGEGFRVRGRVMSVTDTEIIIGTYEQGNRGGSTRSEIAKMSESEREAFRADRQAERDAAGEPEITGEKIITLTSSTQYLRSDSPVGRGPQAGGDREVPEQENIDMEEIIEGATVTVTLKEGTQEAATVSLQQVRQ